MRYLVYIGLIIISFQACIKIHDEDPNNFNPKLDSDPPSAGEGSPFCFVNNVEYEINSKLPSIDGCNSCTCTESLDKDRALISCTEMACSATGCWEGKKAYLIGFSFINEDGQACTCEKNGFKGELICN